MGKLVSIIMPCYNSSAFVTEAIQSIVGQTYPHWELLVMDDHSTDETVVLVREMQTKDDRIVLYTSGENGGVAHQMNKGIALARGEYLARMDSDDISFPARISEQLSFMERSPNVCLCTTDYSVFLSEAPEEARTKHYPEGAGEMRVGLLRDLPVCGPSFFARKEIFENYSFDETLIVGEDYDLFCRIAVSHELSNLPKTLYHYRKHGKGLTDDPGNWKGDKIDRIRKKYLQSTGIRLEDEEVTFFLDLITTRIKYRADRSFFHQVRRLQRPFFDNPFFEYRALRSFFSQCVHDYLLSTRNYGFFAFVYVLAYYPSVFFSYSFKDGLRIITRSLHA